MPAEPLGAFTVDVLLDSRIAIAHSMVKTCRSIYPKSPSGESCRQRRASTGLCFDQIRYQLCVKSDSRIYVFYERLGATNRVVSGASLSEGAFGMIILTTISFLVGAVLGLNFKVWILVPATGLALILVALNGVVVK